jgi:hypothetical protein
MSKHYKKLSNGQWKTYIQLFTKKGTGQRLHLKPGITEFLDGDARMFFNNLNEEESFLQHFDTKVLWSKIYNSKEEAKEMEDYLLDYFDKQSNLGFVTSGHTEVRDYNHQLWMEIKDSLYAA